MQDTSLITNWDTIFADDNHWFETQLIIDGAGTFDENQLFSISTNIEMFQNTPQVGKAVAAEINIEMLKPSVDIPVMAKLQPQVRVCNDTMQSGWMAQGIFYIDTREYTKNDDGLDILTIHGYDAMLKAEQDFQSDTITGDSTTIEMVDAIAALMGVDVDQRTYDHMTPQYEWEEPYTVPLPTGYSCREVLGYIASMYAGCFIMSDIGELRLVSLTELPEATHYLIDGNGDPIVFGTGVTQTKTESGNPVTFADGSGTYLTDCTIAMPFTQRGSGTQSPSNIRRFAEYQNIHVYVGSQSDTAQSDYSFWLWKKQYQGTFYPLTGKATVSDFIALKLGYPDGVSSISELTRIIKLIPIDSTSSATFMIPFSYFTGETITSSYTLYCDTYQPMANTSYLTQDWKCALVTTTDSTFRYKGIAFHGQTGIYRSVYQWAQWFVSIPTTILLKSPSAQTSQTMTAPQEIQNLVGQNYIWSNTNTNVSVQYEVGGEQTRILV